MDVGGGRAGLLTLAQHVDRHGPLGVRDGIGWVVRIAKTMQQLHGHGQVHGCLTSEAVLIESGECAADGAIVHPDELAADELYHSMARAAGAGPSMFDDTWAVGVILYFALTGALPYPRGIRAARVSGGWKPAPPIAVHGAALDAIQPVLDELLPRKISAPSRSSDRVVKGLQRFSPTTADLPALPMLGVGEDPDEARGRIGVIAPPPPSSPRAGQPLPDIDMDAPFAAFPVPVGVTGTRTKGSISTKPTGSDAPRDSGPPPDDEPGLGKGPAKLDGPFAPTPSASGDDVEAQTDAISAALDAATVIADEPSSDAGVESGDAADTIPEPRQPTDLAGELQGRRFRQTRRRAVVGVVSVVRVVRGGPQRRGGFVRARVAGLHCRDRVGGARPRSHHRAASGAEHQEEWARLGARRRRR
jgi:hypothetical protein